MMNGAKVAGAKASRFHGSFTRPLKGRSSTVLPAIVPFSEHEAGLPASYRCTNIDAVLINP